MKKIAVNVDGISVAPTVGLVHGNSVVGYVDYLEPGFLAGTELFGVDGSHVAAVLESLKLGEPFCLWR